MSFKFKLLFYFATIFSFISYAEAMTTYSNGILKNETNNPFFKAIRKEDIKEIKSLINMGADVNSQNEYGYTPLMAAVYKGNIEICRLLVSSGADTEVHDNNGNTLIFFALFDSEKEKMVHYLIEELNVNVNIMNNFEGTPLILAALNDHSKSIELLISAGAKIETSNSKGTALINASINGSLKAAKVLLKFGANIEARNQHSFTPIMEAVFNNDGSMIRFLLKAGADKYVRTTKVVPVKIKKDYFDWPGETHYIQKNATLLDIARQFDKKISEHILINETVF